MSDSRSSTVESTRESEKAVVLLSGGLDSATMLAIAIERGFDCFCLSFDYGQRHLTEIRYAERIARQMSASDFKVVRIDIGSFGGSALTDQSIEVPVNVETTGIPVTYVPARNTVFLSYALGYAEVLGANDIFIGVNAVDYSGYPDCRPEFIEAFEKMANLATKAGVAGKSLKIQTPLIDLPKEGIIKWGVALGVDYSNTVSCYQLSRSGKACGGCDSCRIRRRGFETAGLPDPTKY